MEKQNVKTGTEDQLIQARERGLQEALQVNSMCAHGKVLGMDTFSWVNPQLDVLATLLNSFPFSVLWIGSNNQVAGCLQNYPELGQKIETIVLYETTLLKVKRETLNKIKNVICVDNVSSALEMIKSLKRSKSVLLFTSDGPEVQIQKEKFEKFLEVFK